jgi:hypothetical protein
LYLIWRDVIRHVGKLERLATAKGNGYVSWHVSYSN